MSLEQLLHQISDPSELSWKDETYDLALASGLSVTDRATFVAKLIEQAKQGDTRAILTLGNMNAVEALPALQTAAKSQDPWASTARRALAAVARPLPTGLPEWPSGGRFRLRFALQDSGFAAVAPLPAIG
jgi:hypothetical protein